MESLMENKALLYSLLGSSALIMGLACGFMPSVAAQLEVVDFPSEVSDQSNELFDTIVSSMK